MISHSFAALLVLPMMFTLFAAAATAQVTVKDRSNITVLKSHPPKNSDAPVEILASEPRDRRFEDLCLITASGGQTIANAKKGSDLYKRMQKDARKCGADAIIIRYSSDQTWKPLRGGIDQGARAQALAIRFIDERPPPTATDTDAPPPQSEPAASAVPAAGTQPAPAAEPASNARPHPYDDVAPLANPPPPLPTSGPSRKDAQ